MWLQRRRAYQSTAVVTMLLCWLTCCAMASIPGVRAQFVPEYMRAETPDLQSPRTIAGICLLAISVPVYVAVIALLVYRRRMYPLCNRGSCCLTLLQFDGAVISTVNLVLWILYPRGMPCSMQVITLHLCSSYAAIWLIRGWKQVWRLEILSYLSELEWRENRKAQLHAREAAMKEQNEQNEDDTGEEERSPVLSMMSKETKSASPSPAADPTATVIQITPEATSPGVLHPLLAYPSLDPSTICGCWFIRNRRFTSTRWIGGVFLIWLCLLVSTIVLPAVFDYDITMVNQWRRQHGLEDDTLTNHYLDGAFFASPRCLWYSIKWLCFFGSMLCLACPAGLFCAYRVYLSSVRMKRRMQEQAEFAALMSHESDRGAAPSAAAAAAASSPVRTELDELAAVNVEMAVTVWIGLSNCILIFILTAFDTSHVNLTTAVTVWQGLIVSGIMPLRKSYTIEARQRELFRRARVKSGTRFVASVEHHAPLYQLHHVLNSPTAYPSLLRFLQKEYSSENALFFRSCEEFCRAARKLERALSISEPAWDLNPDDGGEFTLIPQGLNTGRMFLPHVASAHCVSPHPRHQRMGSARLTSFSIEPVPFVTASQLAPAPALLSGGPGAGGLDHVRETSAVRTSSFSSPTAVRSPRSTKVMHGSTDFQSTPSAIRHGRTTSFSAKAQPLAITLPVPALQMVPLQTQTPPSALFASHPHRSPSVSRNESFGPGPRSPKWQPSMHLIESARATPAEWTAAVTSHPSSAAVVPMSPPKTASPAPVTPSLSIHDLHLEALSLRSRAIQLYDDYIKHNAVYQVNVDASLQRFIGTQMAAIVAWNPTVLDDAGQPDIERAVAEAAMPLAPPFALSSLFKSAALSVFALIESDSFRRFLLTEDFQLLLAKADDAEITRRMAVASTEARTDVVLAKADEVLRRCASMRNEATVAAATSLAPPLPPPAPSVLPSPSSSAAHVADFDAVQPVASSSMFHVRVEELEAVTTIDAVTAVEAQE